MSGTITLSSNVLYTYPTPSIGLKTSSDLEVTPLSVSDIVKQYKNLFSEADAHTSAGTYTKIQKNLLDQLNNILGTIKNTSRNYTFNSEGLLPLEDIFDENESPEGANCKEGKKAYKYYLRDIIDKLNSLNKAIREAQKTITDLENLEAKTSSSFNSQAHVLIDYLNIQDKLAQKIINEFQTYSVVKNIINPKIITCYSPVTQKDDGGVIREEKRGNSYQVIEPDYIDLSTKFNSRLSNIKTIEDLRNFQTQKRNLTRNTEYIYWAEDKSGKTDKYDTSAIIEIKTSEYEPLDPEIEKTENSPIALFDELTLLEKLEYIVLYYKYNKDPYIFPNDNYFGYPCIKPTNSNSPTEDTNEIGNLELFYIGYLINHDGPINALAAFMEIKASAIKQQINLLQYRVKALKTYLSLVNKGLEEMQKSQSDGNPHPIPNSAYIILKYIASNTTRSLMYLENDEKHEKPYIVLQVDGEEVKDNDKIYHLTDSNNYILVRADEGGKGIETFLSNCDQIFDNIFKKLDVNNLTLKETTEYSSYTLARTLEISRLPHFNKTFPDDNCLFLKFKGNDKTNAKEKLPKELEVSKIDISSVTQDDYAGAKISWKDTSGEGVEKIWPALIDGWKTCFDSCINSLKSQLEYVQKSITSLRQKINTFDETGSNFRNKAYSIYNKTVNSIN